VADLLAVSTSDTMERGATSLNCFGILLRNYS